ncbi:MAG: hypothetical protein CFE23_10060 [Flavobacterium sp. BFFFF1]|uniref:DUF3575 domain-containing protein n=1 Tax=Flavobacterium sp. BFFFF1 TaxID=2015557 RepID=UPI000BC8F68F|nr:DUF3575 domain-containing protein [Flavobacterium sp. BFFFF1]OYU80241.1 MAG: hypothetical protein CFE23_10060 [Flavobacterium sp. BFFFF1]
MKNNLFAAVAILSLVTASAQTTQPTKIKVFTPQASQISKDNSYKWTVKTDLLGILVGEFPVIAEYRIAPKFSVEASAGVTYAFFPNESLTLTEDDEDIFDTKAAMGTAFRGTIKYYPSTDYDAIEGWSFGIQLFHKTTNREYKTSTDSNPDWDGKQDSKVKTGVSLIISKQIFEDSNISFESFIGVGFAKTKRTRYFEEYNTNTETYDIVENVEDKSVPNVQLGFRIGFGN